MRVEAVRAFLKEKGLEAAYREFSSSSATVALAAAVPPLIVSVLN